LIVLALAGLACASVRVEGFATPSSEQNPAGVPESNSSSIPSNPIGLRAGLSSLNSYRLTIRIINNGPTAQDKNQTTITIESGTDGKSSHTKFESITSSADSPEAQSSITDQYTIGNQQCSFSSGDSESSKSDMDPMAREVLDTWYTLIDLVPAVNEPVLIGEEDINGIRTNHFKFKVGGLGVNSGAEVVSSDGEYWLAQDGQYIVKYSVAIETRNGPAGDVNTKTMHSEFHIEVTDINQNIVITLPANCQ
jgi:hypothetical protein